MEHYKKSDLTKEIQDMFDDMGIELTSENIEKYLKHFQIMGSKMAEKIIEHIKEEFVDK